MKEFFIVTVIALIVSVQNFCSAAQIESATFSSNEQLIYPVVHTSDAAVDRKINTAIIAEVDRFVTGIYRDAQTNDFEIGGILTNYNVACNRAGNTVILSIIMTESSYYKMAAHPSTFQHALNFNLSSGELMGLNYLTNIGGGVSEQEILQRVERALNKFCAQNNIQLFDNALPLKQLPENFYWDENLHVHFIFQQYDVAPYAVGIIDVDIDS